MFSSMSGKFKPYASKMAIIIGVIALMICAWANLFFQVNMSANAATMEGITNQAEGKVQKDIGAIKRATGDITGSYDKEAKGADLQAKGKVKQNIGTTKNKLDDAKNKVEEKSESLIDSVKELFN